MANQAAKQFYMRPMEVDDIAVLALWFERLSDLTLFDSQSTLPVNKEILHKDWERAITGNLPRSCFWYSIENEQEELIGLAGIEAISHTNGDCVLPIILSREMRHQGLGMQIAAMLIDMAFSELRMNRITTYYRADNEVTRNLVASLGFHEEGRMRQARFSGGQYFDQMVVGLLASDWQDGRSAVVNKKNDNIELRFGRDARSSNPWPQQYS